MLLVPFHGFMESVGGSGVVFTQPSQALVDERPPVRDEERTRVLFLKFLELSSQDLEK